jgi:cytochrome c oxidase assembly factor CtaG
VGWLLVPGYSPPPSVLAGLVGLQALYFLCTGPYLNRLPGARRVPTARKVAFSAGVLVMFLALATPLDTLADQYLFTAHMLQHLLLTLIVAPLLLIGTPAWLLRAVLRASHLTGFVRWAHHPLVAFCGFNVIFSLAHVPAFYELTLASEPLHALEHLVFVGTAMLMWMPVVSPVPDISAPYPALGQVLYLFLQTVPASLVGALLAATGSAYYPTYVLAPRITSLSPLEDQQLGGLLMWVGSGTFFLIASGVVFFVWAGREEAANRRPLGVH